MEREEIKEILKSRGWSSREIRDYFKTIKLEEKLKNGNREKARKEALKFLSSEE